MHGAALMRSRFVPRAVVFRDLAAALLLGAPLTPLDAQTPPSGEGAAFCELAGEELVRSLEGSWTLDQGPGGVIYPIPQPLPDQPPVGVRFTWNAEEGVMDAVAADLSDEMILFPAIGEDRVAAEEMIDVGAEDASAEGCAWSTTPVVIGTNWYFSGAMGVYMRSRWERFCSDPRNAEWVGPQCDLEANPYPPEPTFEMEMTLMLRFQTPDYGAGAVFFQGSTEVEGSTYEFGAQAPVTIYRD